MAVLRKPPYDPSANPYPKWVYPEGKPGFIVQSKEEHDAWLATVEVKEPKTDDDKDALVGVAQGLGVEVDKRWGVERLKTEIAAKQKAA